MQSGQQPGDCCKRTADDNRLFDDMIRGSTMAESGREIGTTGDDHSRKYQSQYGFFGSGAKHCDDLINKQRLIIASMGPVWNHQSHWPDTVCYRAYAIRGLMLYSLVWKLSAHECAFQRAWARKFLIRNAGGRASDDAIRSLVISYKLLGIREWFVVHHTDCGMEAFADDIMRDLHASSLKTASVDASGRIVRPVNSWRSLKQRRPGEPPDTILNPEINPYRPVCREWLEFKDALMNRVFA